MEKRPSFDRTAPSESRSWIGRPLPGMDMSFRGVFITVFLGTALVVAAFMINHRRPRQDVTEASAALVRATGKCAECHRRETSAVVHEYEMSRHSANGINCLDCHKPATGQVTL